MDNCNNIITLQLNKPSDTLKFNYENCNVKNLTLSGLMARDLEFKNTMRVENISVKGDGVASNKFILRCTNTKSITVDGYGKVVIGDSNSSSTTTYLKNIENITITGPSGDSDLYIELYNITSEKFKTLNIDTNKNLKLLKISNCSSLEEIVFTNYTINKKGCQIYIHSCKNLKWFPAFSENSDFKKNYSYFPNPTETSFANGNTNTNHSGHYNFSAFINEPTIELSYQSNAKQVYYFPIKTINDTNLTEIDAYRKNHPALIKMYAVSPERIYGHYKYTGESWTDSRFTSNASLTLHGKDIGSVEFNGKKITTAITYNFDNVKDNLDDNYDITSAGLDFNAITINTIKHPSQLITDSTDGWNGLWQKTTTGSEQFNLVTNLTFDTTKGALSFRYAAITAFDVYYILARLKGKENIKINLTYGSPGFWFGQNTINGTLYNIIPHPKMFEGVFVAKGSSIGLGNHKTPNGLVLYKDLFKISD